MAYVRYEAARADSRGRHHGIFALANGLAHDGRLSTVDLAWWRMNNDWLNDAYADPAAFDPTLFDRSLRPEWVCWFKQAAVHILERVPGYLDLLDRYGIGCVERVSFDPGVVLYEDEVQVVVAPYR